MPHHRRFEHSHGGLYDITPTIHAGMPVWPGDTPFGIERRWAIASESPVNVSRIVMSTHTGAHADAPYHYDPLGADSAAEPLRPYLGVCRLIDLSASEGLPVRAVPRSLPQRRSGRAHAGSGASR